MPIQSGHASGKSSSSRPARSSYRLAIDIGGTFTDGVMFEEETGRVIRDKVLTTPGDPSQGFMICVDRLFGKADIAAKQVSTIVHGTTIATNALLERRGARVGMITTEGFRDVIEIGRQIRHDLYDLQVDRPEPLVAREHCLAVRERINSRGEVVVELDGKAVAAAANTLRNEGIESIAICFLHSYCNHTHEQAAAEILRREFPGVDVSCSSDIAPEIKEYWRASTAITNAYISPSVTRYLDLLREKLLAHGIMVPPQIMQSSGGLMSLEQAKRRPIFMLESGPAAGVISASFFADICGAPNAIAFDMGGTTAKMGVIEDGEPKIVAEFEASGVHGTGAGVAPGSGYPILTPTIDLVEISAGGGSIAWIDAGGLLRVGPRSAGASPGPACYGRGGSEPTVTDANLVLGRLNPGYFLGGEMKLDLAAARKAVARCADALSISIEEAALGIIEVAKSRMAEVVRLVTVQRGLDPRDFALVTTGGAGPAMANLLVEELGLASLIVPPSPGTASALGMLVSDVRHELRTTRIVPLGPGQSPAIEAAFDELRARGSQNLTADGVPAAEQRFSRYAEMRYVGQTWTIRVNIADDSTEIGESRILRDAFHRSHERLYGYSVKEEPIEIVNVGVLAIGPVPTPRLEALKEGGPGATHAITGSRPVIFDRSGAVDCKVYHRPDLRTGNIVTGPAIIEEVDSTTVILPGFRAVVAAFGALTVRAEK